MVDLKEVHDEYNDIVYPVKGRCVSCMRSGDYTFELAWVFNISSGLLHRPSWDHSDTTSCGKDCTGETWLHRL